jgi:hypothetical protein
MEKATRNKLVIIGNGFDLAHGFETSYHNFILWYLKGFIKNYNYSDEILSREGCGDAKSQNNGVREIESIKDFQEKYISKELIKIKSNFFNQLIRVHKEYNWVDIEREYYLSIVDIYEKIIQNPSSRVVQVKLLSELNRVFEFLREKLEEYLIDIQKGDIQKLSPKFNGNFGYVFEKEFYESFRDNDKKILFLNFNYTNTIEAYINKKPVPHELIYIHGRLNDSKNPIIFGFGDEIDGYYKKIEELNINEFLNHFKSFGYFQTNNYQNLLSFIESESFDVEILGHSCGLSDRVLLNTIFEHDNCEAIKIHYYAKSNSENDFTFKTQEISRHFNDKAKMRKRIVNFHDCQPLKV